MKDIILHNVRAIKNIINSANKIFDESYWRKDYYTKIGYRGFRNDLSCNVILYHQWQQSRNTLLFKEILERIRIGRQERSRLWPISTFYRPTTRAKFASRGARTSPRFVERDYIHTWLPFSRLLFFHSCALPSFRFLEKFEQFHVLFERNKWVIIIAVRRNKWHKW